MRSLRARVVSVMLGAFVVASVAGCAASPVPAPTPSPTPDAAAPLFASDEEALAAAEDAYAAYQDMSNQIARDGGVDVERMAPLVTAEFFPVAVEGFEEFRDRGWQGSGGVRFDTTSLQQLEQNGSQASAMIYICVDAGEARLLNEAGVDVTPNGRRERTPLLVSFVSSEADPLIFIVNSSTVWSGDDFC